MNILPALSTLLAVVAVAAQPEGALPAYMLGKYVLQTSEGFSDFMYRIDIGWFQRAVSGEEIINHIFYPLSPQLACSLYPVQVFSQDSVTGEITVDTLTTLRSFSSSFSLNTPYTVKEKYCF